MQMTKSNSVEDYLHTLGKALKNKIPQSEIESQQQEIKLHLEEAIFEQEQSNVSRDEAAQHVINEFVSPEELAKQIKSEYANRNEDGFVADDFGFKSGVTMIFSGFGLLGATVYLGELQIESAILGVICILTVLLTLTFKRSNWTSERVDVLKSLGKSIKYIIVPMGGAAAIIRNFIDGAVNFQAFMYMAVYLFTVLIAYFVVKHIYLKKKLLI